MISIEKKKLILKTGEQVLIVLDHKNIEKQINNVETLEYDGRLYGEPIKYHLVCINVNKKEKERKEINCLT